MYTGDVSAKRQISDHAAPEIIINDQLDDIDADGALAE